MRSSDQDSMTQQKKCLSSLGFFGVLSLVPARSNP